MPSVTINGSTVEVPDGTNLVRAAEAAGQEIPHYCYHPGLSVAGNCRMCLVDIKAMSAKQPTPMPKLQIACNTLVAEGMVVETNSPKVEEARRGVLEFLLINHPIDCPVCDQAGECKLQEYYMDYGRHHSRFPLAEKTEKGKAIPIGPDIMLDQERCILCTRCVRFLDEVTGTRELCVHERGDHSELSLAEGASVDNPYATNIVDICPVGALTSREFRFRSRVWYLDSTPSICTGCATGCNIDVDWRGDRIYRLKPRANPDVNAWWICDEGRRTWHGNEAKDRLRASWLRRDGSFAEAAARDAAEQSAALLQGAARPVVVVSASASLEEAWLATRIAARLGQAPVLTSSPASSAVADDSRLVSTDRFPNRAGLVALGIREAVAPPPGVDAVLLVRGDVAREGSPAWGGPLLEGLSCTVLVSDHAGDTMAYADAVVGIASHFEARGAFVSRKGRLQVAQASVASPPKAVAGWQALAWMLAALGGEQVADADQVFARSCEAAGLGSGRSVQAVGPLGTAAADWAVAR